MRAFARLLESLVYTPSRNAKLRLLGDYLDRAPDPDRGWALAAITGGLSFKNAKAGAIRNLIASRTDPVLFGWSYDYVGDLAETVSLIWPDRAERMEPPSLTEVVEALQGAKRGEVEGLLAGWLDGCGPSERFAILKLITGGLRVGVSARLARTALAQWAAVPVEEIEEVWHGLAPPYAPLFDWLTGQAPQPDLGSLPVFRPMMLANPLEEADLARLEIAQYRAEWKWDGIRVQIAAKPGDARVFSRTGDDITHAIPDLADHLQFDAVLDGELLVLRGEKVAPFNDLQQRLNRKTVTAKMLRDYPVHIRAYDILFDGYEDLRPLGFDERRRRLEAWHRRIKPQRIDLSEMIGFKTLDELSAIRDGTRAASIEGLMLKRHDAPYLAGRPKGPWWKWKRDPLTLDCVLMYAQRGHGKRSSFYSDFTFGAWRAAEAGGEELVPVGKAYFGFTDAELAKLDKWVRANTTNRFGPVREVEPGLVIEVAFDSVHPSTRHKSGVAMRFPRFHRIRWDKPIEEADRLDTLKAMIVG